MAPSVKVIKPWLAVLGDSKKWQILKAIWKFD